MPKRYFVSSEMKTNCSSMRTLLLGKIYDGTITDEEHAQFDELTEAMSYFNPVPGKIYGIMKQNSVAYSEHRYQVNLNLNYN